MNSIPLATFGLSAATGDPSLGRELTAALVALAIFVGTAPRGRRRLAWLPAALFLLAPLPLAIAALFPSSQEAPALVLQAVRFFLLASLVQSALLLAAVSVWERIVRPMPRIFLDLLRLLAGVAVLLAVLYESGVRGGNLFTGSALLTAVLGFALKDTLGNVFAGLAIHAEHPFEIGDWIQYDTIPAHIGKVVEINWRATKVHTLDEAYVIIPNGQLAQASIRNFTKPDPWSRRSLFVVAPYEVSPQRVQRVILDAIGDSFGVLAEPAPSVVTNDFKERGVEYWVRLFTSEFDKRDRVDGMARDRIWYAFAREGIEIPVATQQIRLSRLERAASEPAGAAAHRRESLRRVGVFAPLDDEQIARLAGASVDRVFAAGEPVIRQGTPGSSLFVVVDGRVEVTARDDGLPAVRLAALGRGDYFGEMSLMTGAPRSATVTALVESQLLEVPKDAFRGILAAEPRLVEQIGEALQRRLADRAQAMAVADREVPEAKDVFGRITEFFSL